MEIKIDYDNLSRVGLTVADVAQNVRIAYDGEVVTSVRYGDEDVDRDAAIELNRTNLQLLADEYSDIPHWESTYGQTAERMLSAHDPADLEIGKKAPEIIGTDVDGNEMKLSDYLGKVVVIDFWGDW